MLGEHRMKQRCFWAKSDIMIAYHDEEWGRPVHDDRKLFEHIILDGAQAGLSWEIILRKRDNYRAAFDGFDPVKVARFDARRIRKLLGDAGIVRNRLKIVSAVENAKAVLKVQKEFGSLDTFLWDFVGGKPKINTWQTKKQIPAASVESEAMSKELRRRGFRFMQASGLVNDHLVDCFRHRAK
jgi:DNA-3-methyladenine glycosylase I